MYVLKKNIYSLFYIHFQVSELVQTYNSCFKKIFYVLVNNIFCQLDLSVSPHVNFSCCLIHEYVFIMITSSWYLYVISLNVPFDVFAFEFYFVLILKFRQILPLWPPKRLYPFILLFHCMRILVSPLSNVTHFKPMSPNFLSLLVAWETGPDTQFWHFNINFTHCLSYSSHNLLN